MSKNKIDAIIAMQELAIRKARRSFWAYSQLKAPDFYKRDRDYLRRLCNEMQNFYESDDEVAIINLPPRHGKSRSVQLLVEWLFGQNNQLKIMTGSYNETLSTTFSKSVRNSIAEEKAEATKIVYSDIFPDTEIKRGDAAANLWGLVGGHYNYLATSPTGTATGFGADMLIIDDLIKNAEEAFNDNVLEKHWDWFTKTMLSRLQEGGKILIVMTRWASKDLAGRAIEHFKEEGKKIRVITMKAMQDDGTMLCEEVLSKRSYDSKARAMGLEIASANYQQEPIDLKGRLYSSFKTYDKLPTIIKVSSYTDTADTGSDYLASFIFGETMQKEAYILDVVYTKDSMEITEPLLAKKLHENQVNYARIESNSGGRGFGRSVERILKEKYGSNRTKFDLFHQSKNKVARILSNATWVMEHVYFPVNWQHKWPELYKALSNYQREGKNSHDDAPDALTGVAEYMFSNGATNRKEKYKALQSLGL